MRCNQVGCTCQSLHANRVEKKLQTKEGLCGPIAAAFRSLPRSLVPANRREVGISATASCDQRDSDKKHQRKYFRDFSHVSLQGSMTHTMFPAAPFPYGRFVLCSWRGIRRNVSSPKGLPSKLQAEGPTWSDWGIRTRGEARPQMTRGCRRWCEDVREIICNGSSDFRTIGTRRSEWWA